MEDNIFFIDFFFFSIFIRIIDFNRIDGSFFRKERYGVFVFSF